MNPLYNAIKNEDYSDIEVQIANGAHIDHNVLNKVIYYHNIHVLNSLIKYANINEISQSLLSCINFRHPSEEAILVLINAGGNIDKILGNIIDRQYVLNTSLMNAVVNELPYSVLKQLINAGAVVNDDILNAIDQTSYELKEFLLNTSHQTEKLANYWLHNWVFEKMHLKKDFCNLPLGIDQYFKKKESYTLYRGLFWTNIDIDESKFLDFSNFNLNDNMTINLNQLTSWSQDKMIAWNFAHHPVINRNKIPKTRLYGVILKCNVAKTDVLADINMSLNISHEEHEIILYPGNYNCNIHMLFQNDKEVNQITLVH